MDTATGGLGKAQHQEGKVIGDLEALVQAVRTSLRPAKTWQRQLLQLLLDIERKTQVLRMVLLMNRPTCELAEARGALQVALRVALQQVTSSRADQGTKMAIGLACDLGQRIDEELSGR